MTEKQNNSSNQSADFLTNFKACDATEKQVKPIHNLKVKEVSGQGKKGFVKIDIVLNYCKGCEICVAFCPEKVLVMEREVAQVADISKCTKCNICEYLCPDFSISVE